MVKSYFEAIKTKDFEQALSFYGADFYSATPREEWKKNLMTINQKLGDLKSYQQTGWRMQAVTGTHNGTVFQFQYKVDYSNYSADEEIQLFRPTGSNEIKITKHQINSKGFLK